MRIRDFQKNRRSIRLRGYDYSRAGAYFVTVCVQNRECLFGDVVDGKMILNDAGMMIQIVWNEIPAHYPGIEIDALVIMPNHTHGIVVIVGAGPRACPVDGQPQGVDGHNHRGLMGNHRGLMGNHRGLPLRCHCRMSFTDSKP